MKLQMSVAEVQSAVKDWLATKHGITVQESAITVKTSYHGTYDNQEMTFDGLEIDLTNVTLLKS